MFRSSAQRVKVVPGTAQKVLSLTKNRVRRARDIFANSHFQELNDNIYELGNLAIIAFTTIYDVIEIILDLSDGCERKFSGTQRTQTSWQAQYNMRI